MINKHLKPFKLCVLQNFPYIEEDFDALTNYQLLCKIVEFLNKTIDSQNEVITEVGQLHNAFFELKNYVEDYLKNHLKEDVDAKLDEMAEDGTLENLISKYISEDLKHIYNSLELLKIADLTENQKVQTLGYHTLNDGGGANYIIRNTTPSGYYETLNNGKFAELIIDDTINVKQLGAYGDNINDDYNAFNTALNISKKIYIPIGNYKISQQLILPENTHIFGENTEKSKLYINYGIVINKNNCTIENISVIGSKINGYDGIDIQKSYTKILNCHIANFRNGIGITANNYVGISTIENCRLNTNYNAGIYISSYSASARTCINLRNIYSVSNGTITGANEDGTLDSGYGIYIQGGYGYNLESCWVDSNSGYGLYLSGLYYLHGVNVSSLYCESNKISNIYFKENETNSGYRDITFNGTFSVNNTHAPNAKKQLYVPLEIFNRDYIINSRKAIDTWGCNIFLDFFQLKEKTNHYYMPASLLEYLYNYTDHITTTKDNQIVKDGSEYYVLETKYIFGLPVRFASEPNKVYRIKCKYKRFDINNPTVSSVVTISRTGETDTIKTINLTVSDDWQDLSFEVVSTNAGSISLGGYYNARPDDFACGFKDFVVEEIDSSSTKPTNPPIGFRYITSSTIQTWNGTSWV